MPRKLAPTTRSSFRRGAAALAMAGLLFGVAVAASAQEVAPRQTGTMVVSELAKAEQAVQARAASMPDIGLPAVATKLKAMGAALTDAMGDDAGEPLDTIGADARAAALRADAAAKRVQAWLAAAGTSCSKDEVQAMVSALSATLDQLSADDASQKAALPMIDGVATLDKRPLFVLRQGEPAPKFVLTGANLVDTRCDNPDVVAVGADGAQVAAQPQLIAAQPGQVELQWSDAAKLAPGNYVLRLTAKRKAFLVGCRSEPATVAVLHVLPPLRFAVSYALIATCAGSAAPVVLGSGDLPTLTARNRTVSRTLDASKCPNPTSYVIAGTVRAGDGPKTKFGPVTQSADATVTTGLGDGLTLSWDPSLRQLFVRTGAQTCKGVY